MSGRLTEDRRAQLRAWVKREPVNLTALGVGQLLDECDRLRDLLRDIRDNYDCDADAHRYGHEQSQCRCCKAAAALG